MKAVVLVGGFGTRLRPLTNSIPKPMLPVGHRPILEWVVEHLGRHGIEEAVLSLGFNPDAFVDAYPGGSCAGVNISYAVEPEPLDTAGAIRFAARAAGLDETFIVVNGDVLSDVDITALVAFHRSTSAQGTLHLTGVEDPSTFGVVPTEANGRVVAFIEKPARDEAPTNNINAGTYVMEPSTIDRIATGRKVSIERETFPAMVEDGTLFAMASSGYWLDTGRPDQYLAANLDVLAGRRAHQRKVEPFGEGARVSGLVSESVIGSGCVVEGAATVTSSVLLANVRVERGAVVERTIVGPRSVIGVGVHLSDCVIGADVVIDAGLTLMNMRVPQPQ